MEVSIIYLVTSLEKSIVQYTHLNKKNIKYK